jgi:hypothetical protein
MAEKVPVVGGDRRIEIVLFRGHLEGLCALTAWLDGFEAGPSGTVPGHHELVMHVRHMISQLQKAD